MGGVRARPAARDAPHQAGRGGAPAGPELLVPGDAAADGGCSRPPPAQARTRLAGGRGAGVRAAAGGRPAARQPGWQDAAVEGGRGADAHQCLEPRQGELPQAAHRVVQDSRAGHGSRRPPAGRPGQQPGRCAGGQRSGGRVRRRRAADRGAADGAATAARTGPRAGAAAAASSAVAATGARARAVAPVPAVAGRHAGGHRAAQPAR